RLVSTLLLEHRASGYSQSYFLYYYMFSWVVELKSGSEFFQHLLRREEKKKNGFSRSRIEKGLKEDLERLLRIAKNHKPMNFEVFIVQPSLSKQATTSSIMTLLGVTENYLKEVADIDLRVIVNE
ncbi:hypothetical protein, partial [Acinetobacter ursingii]|uniref:hypothetical protein n=1 Tax=Acinetobacter ursingii TaxID=108980 RepID=UPI003AF68436